MQDLLPALVQDQYKNVITSLLEAGRRLSWDAAQQRVLLDHALTVAEWAESASEGEVLKEALFTLHRLGREQSQALCQALELVVLRYARALRGFDLRDVLRATWTTEATRSAAMAELRLRLARDPHINDRLNHRDYDEELTDLLACGPGLRGLPATDLVDAALDYAPDYPLVAAEFAEVAWRAGRPIDAEAVMAAVLAQTPDVPAFVRQRSIAECLRAAAAADAAASAGDSDGAADDVSWAALQRLPDFDADDEDDSVGRLARQVSLRLAIRATLAGRHSDALGWARLPAANAVEPAAARRERADRLSVASEQLAESAREQTATGAYLRAYADACRTAAHLLRFDAAELDGDSDGRAAQLTAAARRAAETSASLSDSLGADDPLAAPLLAVLTAVPAVDCGDNVQALLDQLASLALPVVVVRGPRGHRHAGRAVDPPPPTAAADASDLVAVAFASIDGRAITGPQVLRPNTVHRLQLEVLLDHWPEWATSLDAELVSHLTVGEAETPAFSWRKPGDLDDVALQADGPVILRFGLPAGQQAPPFRLRLRFRGERDGEACAEKCDVAGHREIRLRPFDSSRDGLTEYRVVDEHLLRLYEQLHGAGFNEDEIQAFCRLLTAVCRAGFTMTWEKRYKRGGPRVRERDFHDDLFDRLMADPDLGGRVERGSPLALGFLDVRHGGITAELKVEHKAAVTKDTAPKYIGQPTQYAGADGARLSILCVLDMSPKERPVGTPENYIFQLKPALHGLDNPEAPSIVTVVIVNANLPTPSSWSRRKAEVQDDAGVANDVVEDAPQDGTNPTVNGS